MRSADTQSAVTHCDNYGKFGISQLEPGCIRQCSSMNTMDSMYIEKGVKQSGTADVSDDNRLVGLKP